jgi:hypothetical protein
MKNQSYLKGSTLQLLSTLTYPEISELDFENPTKLVVYNVSRSNIISTKIDIFQDILETYNKD